ncbi:hypothetical protein SCATT_01690 [Streptantibioticus cattleyicolor NRRL 8057 = DSM 46488]|uniref:Uncharacterized protein n=1 Tax=Streptantibioticus cattleyicolor (strain ATCC 35852 / DSM 46488 / JCM 4925 / NBRC 14057 / NRRL 8057) TaxID=1003195 RepID=G8X1L2_STREN|nr:hypothetical protein SCATT_01690 [Streptantibioticus cattleyicolor NRRL 8057 = DSM 46488]
MFFGRELFATGVFRARHLLKGRVHQGGSGHMVASRVQSRW